MNGAVWKKQKQGIAIALKQFPWLREWDKESGIYLWYRYNEEDKYCWYIGKAKNILRRTAQHIMDGESHLDKSIKKHGMTNDTVEKPNNWSIEILRSCKVADLDEFESFYINQWKQNNPNGIMYNIESGGTTGKTIIGERKQRKDQKWRTEARTKAFGDIHKWFDLLAKKQAIKPSGELYAEAKKIYEEFYNKNS